MLVVGDDDSVYGMDQSGQTPIHFLTFTNSTLRLLDSSRREHLGDFDI